MRYIAGLFDLVEKVTRDRLIVIGGRLLDERRMLEGLRTHSARSKDGCTITPRGSGLTPRSVPRQQQYCNSVPALPMCAQQLISAIFLSQTFAFDVLIIIKTQVSQMNRPLTPARKSKASIEIYSFGSSATIRLLQMHSD